ncbi:MAG: CsgG/HfaB family protein [Armatimonadota bacterium]|nr:CsgG/HfaB family protein [Armatimonadota bacterium]
MNTFTATGRAVLGGSLETAQRRALENALWLVVDQAVQSMVPTDSRIEHKQTINAILARPRQHIVKYEITQRGPSKGYFLVRVRAIVARSALASRLRASAIPFHEPAVRDGPTRTPQLTSPAPPTIPAAQSANPPEVQGGPVALTAASTPSGPAITAAAQSPPAAAATQTGRPRIAVLLFQLGITNPQWTQSWDIAIGVTDLVEEALHSSGRYRIIERRQIEQVLREQELGASGSVNAATAAKIGRILGVRHLVMGSVNQFDLRGAGGISLPGLGLGLYRAQVDLTSRVVDTSTAEIVAIVRGSGRADGTVVLAQLQGLTFGGGEFRQSVLGKALDQAIQELVVKLNGTMSGQQ